MMSWLRIDDGFARHPKITRLTRSDRWTWVEVLCYVARYRTEGIVSESIGEVVRGATPAYLKRCRELGLLDDANGEYVVHDWNDYNGRDPRVLKNERQQRWRNKQATTASTEASTQASTPPSTESPTRAQARARVPQPHRELANASSLAREKDDLWEALVQELGEPRTKSERGRYNAAHKELREIDASPIEVHSRCRAYRRKWPEMALTPQALTGNWTQLDAPPRPNPVPVSEVVDMPEITNAEREANLERARQLGELLGKGVQT